MSDMPEKIYCIDNCGQPLATVWSDNDQWDSNVEYVRLDIYEALEEKNENLKKEIIFLSNSEQRKNIIPCITTFMGKDLNYWIDLEADNKLLAEALNACLEEMDKHEYDWPWLHEKAIALAQRKARK